MNTSMSSVSADGERPASSTKVASPKFVLVSADFSSSYIVPPQTHAPPFTDPGSPDTRIATGAAAAGELVAATKPIGAASDAAVSTATDRSFPTGWSGDSQVISLSYSYPVGDFRYR